MIEFIQQNSRYIYVKRGTETLGDLYKDEDEWDFNEIYDDYPCFTSDELRQIADKLDELNKK